MNLSDLIDQRLVFHPEIPVHHLTASMTVQRLIYLCNQQRNSESQPSSDMTNLLRVNLFANEFQKGMTIIKPIQVELKNLMMTVVRGDTRLMAASLVPAVYYAPVVALISDQWSSMFDDWHTISHWDQLTDLLGFPSGCVRWQFHDQRPTSLSFLEFALPQTEHHLHDDDQRLRMMSRYLEQQGRDFRFSEQWILTPIDWLSYDF